MGKLLLFEGFDGSGKTTLIENLKAYLSVNKITYIEISKSFNAAIKCMTDCIIDREITSPPNPDILMRLAREFEKIDAANKNLTNYDFIILDRSIVSALSWIFYYGVESEIFKPIIKQLLKEHKNAIIIYCALPFEIAWKRIDKRDKKSIKDQLGKNENRKIYEALMKTFREIDLSMFTIIAIDTQQSESNCLSQLIKKIQLN